MDLGEGSKKMNLMQSEQVKQIDMENNGDDEYQNINEDEFFDMLEQESLQNNQTSFKGQGLKKERIGQAGLREQSDRSNQKKKSSKLKKLEQLPLTKRLLIYLLRFTFESSHHQDQIQKYAEDRIFREIKQNCMAAIGLLIEIASDPIEEQAMDDNSQMEGRIVKKSRMGTSDLVKTAAAVQLGQINKSQYQTIRISDENKVTLIKSIMVILCQQQNSTQVKRHMSKALVSILEKEREELKDEVLKFVYSILQSQQFDKQIGSLLCIESVISVPLNDLQIQYILNSFFSPLYQIGDQLYKMCNAELIKYQEQVNQVRSNWQRPPQDWEDDTIDKYKVSTQILEDKLAYLENWGQLMNKIVGLITFKKNILTKENSFQLLNNPFYFQVLYNMINMQAKVEEQIKDCLISFTTCYGLDSQLNCNLVNYLKIVSRFIKLLLKHRNNDYSLPENIKNTPFCLMLKDLIPRAVVSLKGLNQFLINYGQLYNEFKVEETKNQIMSIVKQSLKISELQNYFYDIKVSFICDYIAPLLQITPNDYEDFKKFGPSFLQYLQEFLNMEDPDKNKTSAAKLIIRFSKYVHGSLSFFVQFFLENIHSIINGIPSSDPMFQTLGSAQNSLIKQKYQEENQLDMSTVVLISVRKLIKQRKDLIQNVDGFLINNCQLICNLENRKLSYFAISQILLFFTEMSDTVLLNNQDVFMRYFQLLLDCTNSHGQPDLVGFCFQTYKNIYDIVSNKSSSERLRPHAVQIFQLILSKIQDRKFDMYFECLNAIMQKYKKEIFIKEEDLYTTMNTLLVKLFNSCTLSKNKSKMHLEGVKNPLYMLEIIISWDELTQDMRQNIDQLLDPLYKCLQTSKEHDLAVSILRIFRLNMEKQNGIKTENQLQTIYLLKYVYEREEIFIFEIYKIINYIIQQQPQYLAENQPLFQFFLHMGIDGIKTTSRFSGAFDKSLGCLVVHLMMHHFNTLITLDDYRAIIQSTCYSFKQEFYEQYLETRLMEVVLSCFEINFSHTLSVLQQLQQTEKKCHQVFDKMLEILLNKVGIFQEVYDKKLYIIGCCKLLLNYDQIPFIQANFIEFFTRVLDMLLSIKKDQEFVAKQMEQRKNIVDEVKIVNKKPDLNSQSDSSDIDDFYDEETKQNNQDSDDDDDDHINYDPENKSLKEIYQKNKKKDDIMQVSEDFQVAQNRKKQLAHTYMHRDVQEMYEDPNDYKKVQKYIQTTFIEDLPEIKNSMTLGALEKHSENSYDDLRKLKRAQKSLKLLHTPLKKLDEFTVFQKMFMELKEKLGQDVTILTSSLTQYQIQNLEEILKTKRVINEQESQEDLQSIRKIVKLKKKNQQQEISMNNSNGNNQFETS
ncbi:hypothetical protein ABPG74_011398 [Tetrahymena malaccensis]